jgi:hypothetical protein
MENRWYRRVAWTLLIAALALRAWVYVQGARHIPVTTDEAITVLQAKRIAEGEAQWLMYAQPYMFPVEAYGMVPFLGLPRNAWGMRVLTCLEGLAMLAITLAVLRRQGGLRDGAAGYLLALFPSAYLLTNTFGYSQPHNNSAFLLSLLGLLGAQRLLGELPLRTRIGWLLFTGLACGAAFANAMLALSLVAPILLVALCNGSWKRLPLHAAGLAAGAYVGLLPYLYAKNKFPGAHEGVTGTRSWARAWEVITGHLFTGTLPRTLGIGAPIFPDRDVFPWNPLWLAANGGRLAALLLVLLLAWRAAVHLKVLAKGQCPRLDLADLGLGVCLACVLSFAKSIRSTHDAYRYLAPVLLVLPFLFAAAQRALPRRLSQSLLGLAIAYGLANTYNMAKVGRMWRHPDFANEIVHAPDLAPALAILRQEGIRHAYAQHWSAYRINFLTDEQILCSQPDNERFRGWPIPYKDHVDLAERVAYVLTERNRFMGPEDFRRHLETMGVAHRELDAGDYRVFLDFQTPKSLQGLEKIPSADLAFAAPDFRDKIQVVLADGDTKTYAHSLRLQQSGMAIEISWSRPETVSRLHVDHGHFGKDSERGLHLSARVDGAWQRIAENVEADWDKFGFRHGAPRYGGSPRSLSFAPVRADALRLEIARPDPRRAWTLAEIGVYRVAAAPASAGQ